jgi:hypothetical protein
LLGIKPLDIRIDEKHEHVLLNASFAAVEKLKQRGATVFPNNELLHKPLKLIRLGPWLYPLFHSMRLKID